MDIPQAIFVYSIGLLVGREGHVMRRFRFMVVLVISTALLAHGAQAIGLVGGDRSVAVPGRYVVKFRSDVRLDKVAQSLSTGQAAHAVSRLETRATLQGASDWERWGIVSSTDTSFSIAQARQAIGDENIEIIEPDYTLEFFSDPDDSLFSWQWYLRNTGQDYPSVYRRDGDFNDTLIYQHGTPGADMNLEPLYEAPPAEHTRVVVGIVDTGIDPLHPDLAGQFWRNPDEIPGNGVDDDHNGFVDDTLGYDVSGDILSVDNPVPDNDPTDIIGHGTHVAGIIGAAANGRGIVGVAPSSLIMGVKIRPNATTSIGAAGIMYAVNAGAKVINISWGTGYRSLIVEEALRIARRNGVFVAIAAGNTGTNDRLYPGAGDSAFTVGAGNAFGNMTSFSTWGPQIQVVAPGEGILSLRATNTDLYASANEPGVHKVDSAYYLADGTSMAAPMVAGAAALLWSYRPDLTLNQLESILRMGSDDLIDPLSRGDSLPGPDTISGYGYLNVANSLSLLTHGGLQFVSPANRSRYLDSTVVKIGAVGGYTGGWSLAWGMKEAPESWQTLATGAGVPADSIAAVMRSDIPSGLITLRLSDDFGTSVFTRCVFVNDRALSVTSPHSGDTVNYYIPISGSVYGTDFDSLVVDYVFGASAPVRLTASTAETFDTVIYSWSASGIVEGDYIVRLHAYFGSTDIEQNIPIYLKSAFALGWPQKLTGRGGLTPVCADLDHNGSKELIVATTAGLNVFRADGRWYPGFPVLTDQDVHCIPAIYDVDHDGKNEIILTSAAGIDVVKSNATEAVGWPRRFTLESSGFGFSTPTVVSFFAGSDTVITLIDQTARIRAYRLNGTSYLYSLGGNFANFLGYAGNASYFNGNSVTAADLDGDLKPEVVATFFALTPGSGVALFDGRTGEPAFGMSSPHVISGYGAFGTLLADLNGDNLPEIITVGYDDNGLRTLWVKTRGVDDLPGWPHTFPEVASWRGNYPMVADLDLDGVPEILVTFFEYDIGSLYVFKADGTPFVDRPGRPAGEIFRAAVTFSAPTVGDLTGDLYPEIVIRGGHIIPNSGDEMVYVLSYEGIPVPGWPVATPADPSSVFSTPFAPLIDDINSDGRADLALVSEPGVLYVWNFTAPHDTSMTPGRLFLDNRNGGVWKRRKTPTDVEPGGDILPTSVALRQNYPNPFNPVTTIGFDLPRQMKVDVSVLNILGQQVRMLFHGTLAAGRYNIPFNGTGLASGTYFYRLLSGDGVATKKMLLLK
jgi:subtilisin family serine protease